MKTKKINIVLASLFTELADLLEFLGENHFKVLSYRRAAQTLENIDNDELAAAAPLGRLTTLPHIGDAIAKKINEFIETGRIHKLEDVRGLVPEGVQQMIRELPVAPKRITTIYRALGVENMEQLREAVSAGKLNYVQNLGEKTKKKLSNFFD